jgi:hypothetical protein
MDDETGFFLFSRPHGIPKRVSAYQEQSDGSERLTIKNAAF